MDRREFLRLTGAALAGLSLTGATGNASTRPNLLVILTDDQPYYTVRYMNAVSSWIADQGLNFSPYAYVSTPRCSPARSTLLTGKWSHNATLSSRDTTTETIGGRLKKAGYTTGLGGKYQNGYDGKQVPPGWDSWFAMVEPVNKLDSFRYRTNTQIRKYSRLRLNETDVLSDWAVQFVRSRANSPQPWFAYVCPHAPHGPHTPARRHADEFETKRLRSVPSVGEKDLSDKPTWVRKHAPYTDTERQRHTEGYRGTLQELQEVDDLVERLIGTLRDTNQLANTWIFFLTDNGYLLGEHGLGGKTIPYEEASRTPFIVRGPGLPGGRRSEVMVSHVDLPPTLLDLAGASWSDLDGRSLVPVLAGGGARPAGWRDAVYVEYLGDDKPKWRMLRTTHYAYVEWSSGEKELYNMDSDPYQLRSLHADRDKADLIRQLSRQLSAMKSCSGNSCRSAEVAP